MATACMLRSALVRTCRLLHGLPRWKSRRVLEPNNFAGNELSLRELAFPFYDAFLVERPADLSVTVKLASDLRPATDSESTQRMWEGVRSSWRKETALSNNLSKVAHRQAVRI